MKTTRATLCLLLASGCATTAVRPHAPDPEPPPPAEPRAEGGEPRVWSLSTSERLDTLAPRTRWKRRSTPSFALYYLDPTLAARVATAAERLRTRLVTFWGGDPTAPWRPRCQVALYPTNKSLVTMTGGDAKAGSAQTRAARLTPGKLLARRIHLAADDRELLSATLPHEITHVVIAHIFGAKGLPLWANEGMAVAGESADRNRRWRRIVDRAARQGRLLRLDYLLKLREYPARQRNLFYAQSESLTRLLLAWRGPRHLLAFLADARDHGLERALRRSYGLGSVAELERMWLARRFGRRAP